MYILGINGDPGGDFHDCSAALLKDGEIIAAAEQERFSRRKHAYGEIPINAIEYVLSKANITLEDVDFIASSWQHPNYPTVIPKGMMSEYARRAFPTSIFRCSSMPEIRFISHHMAHISGAYFESGFEDAACLIIDGQGENEAITLAHCKNKSIKILGTYKKCFSLGALYDAAAGYCGLGYDVPGKLMGLAPYGQPTQHIPIKFDDVSGQFEFDGITINEDASFISTRDTYLEFFKENNYPYHVASFGNVSDAELFSYIDFAASVQNKLNECIVGLASYLKKITNSDSLIISGGVALNCTANGVLDSQEIYKKIFVYPAANDAGCSVGAAYEVARQCGNVTHRDTQMQTAYLGAEFSEAEICRVLDNSCFILQKPDPSCFVEQVVELLASGKIVAWFNGAAEFGPRALGARSILASPESREMLLKINTLKNRELWRPLSPVVLDSQYSNVFEDVNPGNMTAFMLKTCKIKKEWCSRIPAVVHIDRTSRPQLLRYESNALLYKILSLFFKKTGIPLLINTSFNIRGEPIVNKPLDAFIAFEKTNELDALIMAPYIIQKQV